MPLSAAICCRISAASSGCAATADVREDAAEPLPIQKSLLEGSKKEEQKHVVYAANAAKAAPVLCQLCAEADVKVRGQNKQICQWQIPSQDPIHILCEIRR